MSHWIQENRVSDDMRWKGAAEREFATFVEFAAILGGEPMVISTHTSKSIALPVVQITTPYGLRVTIRDNFMNIKVSVEASKPCTNDLFGLLAGGDSDLRSCYFEGFPYSFIFEPFILGAAKFSVCTNDRDLFPLARALRWYFDGEDPALLAEMLKDENIRKEVERRGIAEAEGLPVLFEPSTVVGLFRFFETETDIEPNEAKLRHALSTQGPGYDGKVKDEPIPYVELDFSAGCPKPVDAWLGLLEQLVFECQNDPNCRRLGGDRGVRVNVNRLTPELTARAKDLKLEELLKPADRR